MSLILIGVACLLTCLGQVAQKYAVESWRDRPSALLDKLRSPWLWLALASLGLACWCGCWCCNSSMSGWLTRC